MSERDWKQPRGRETGKWRRLGFCVHELPRTFSFPGGSSSLKSSYRHMSKPSETEMSANLSWTRHSCRSLLSDFSDFRWHSPVSHCYNARVPTLLHLSWMILCHCFYLPYEIAIQALELLASRFPMMWYLSEQTYHYLEPNIQGLKVSLIDTADTG